MKVTIFTAADYVDAPAGRLTIVGVFDNIELENCPSVFGKPLGVAAKILVEPHDKEGDYPAKVVLRKVGAEKPVFQIPSNLHFIKGHRERVGALAMALSVIGAKFESFGEYRLELLIGSRVRASTSLNIVKKAVAPSATDNTPKRTLFKAKKK
jgi:hypothetical protein